MFDTHCHFNLDDFQKDVDAIIKSSKKSGVDRFLVPGVDPETSKRSLSLSALYPGAVFSAIGIHPSYSNESDSELIDEFITRYRSQVAAIGEIGLDYFRDFSPRAKQLSTFKKMLEIARRINLPIVLHNRDAEDDLLKTLEQFYMPNINGERFVGVFHAFDGSSAIWEWGQNHNFLFGIGGMVTYKNNENLRQQVMNIGLDRIVLETDSPYLTPVPYRGERNTPKNLNIIVEELSNILGESIETVRAKTTENALYLFGLN